jgi:aryl-alcohol dehydrogenase-like predicted oxidoreductase
MTRNPFGRSGLQVSILGFGAMHLNDESVSEADAGRLLHAVLDLGVNLIDTARGYGLSEERIGRHLSSRRQEFLLSTKVGYGIPGFEDWTHDCVMAGVDAALARLQCDHIDIVHLHSCPQAVLAQGDVILALERCRDAGKLRVVAYSGDNEDLDFAIECRRFASVQTSVGICDQINFEGRLQALQPGGMGVIAKRPLSGAVWNRPQRPDDPAEGAYWDRWQAMSLTSPSDGIDTTELALRFVAHSPFVSSCIVGTRSLAHFEQNVKRVEQGPLHEEQVDRLQAAFRMGGRDWRGMI